MAASSPRLTGFLAAGALAVLAIASNAGLRAERSQRLHDLHLDERTAAAARGQTLVGPLPRDAAGPRRIVSLIPATTEMLFAIGAGERVVGVGSFDRFPSDVAQIPRVGGLIDPDTERIVRLRPDLVVVYNTQVDLKQRLDRAAIPYYSYEHRALPDIMATIRALGSRVGAAPRADVIASEMERGLAVVRASVAGRPRPKTMLVFGRDPGAFLRNVQASGGYGFLADLLDVAGGDNVFGDIERQSVPASTEMILTRRPDVIVELRYGANQALDEPAFDVSPWTTVASVPAVRDRRIHVLTGDEFVIPGPRIVVAAQRLARVLHAADR
jgi:iron complex transport system substrate-binding protein